MNNKSDDHLPVIKAKIEANRKDYDEKIMKLTEYLTEMISSMMDQIKISKFSPDNKDSPKAQDTTTLAPDNNRDLPLEGGHSTKMVACGLSNMTSARQNYMNSSSRHNSKSTLLWTSITSTTTSICVSMR